MAMIKDNMTIFKDGYKSWLNKDEVMLKGQTPLQKSKHHYLMYKVEQINKQMLGKTLLLSRFEDLGDYASPQFPFLITCTLACVLSEIFFFDLKSRVDVQM